MKWFKVEKEYKSFYDGFDVGRVFADLIVDDIVT